MRQGCFNPELRSKKTGRLAEGIVGAEAPTMGPVNKWGTNTARQFIPPLQIFESSHGKS